MDSSANRLDLAAPDAQSAARIANREAVIAQIKVQQKASGCAVGESAQDSQATQPTQPSQAASTPAANNGNAGNTGNAGNAGNGGAASGQQVCNGSTVTLSGEAGAPAASSGAGGG